MDPVKMCPGCKSPIARPDGEPRHVQDDIAVESLLDEFTRLRATLEREGGTPASGAVLFDDTRTCVVCAWRSDDPTVRVLSDSELLTRLSRGLEELRTALARVRGHHASVEGHL